MGNFLYFRRAPGLMLSLLLIGATPAKASISAIEGGLHLPQVSGISALRFESRLGYRALVEVNHPSLGAQTAFYGAVQYQPLDIRGLSGGKMHFTTGVVGLRAFGSGAIFGIRPYVGLGLGMSYGWISQANSQTSFQNTSAYFTAQFDSGFYVHVAGPASVGLQLQCAVITARSPIVIFGETLSLRWSL